MEDWIFGVATSDAHLRMSGGIASDKQPTDTAAEDASSLLQLQGLHHTHREATRLFLMAARQGATDEEIADALRQGLPHLTDPASLQDRRADKQPGGDSQKARQAAEQRTKARTKARTASEPPPEIAADPFTAALAAVPAEDWCRTWAADRTIMLRMTSKRVKELVDKIRPPAVVYCRQFGFFDDELNGRPYWDNNKFLRRCRTPEKLQLLFRQLAALTAGCRITTLGLCLDDDFPDDECYHPCSIKGQDAERLAGVLAQCPALAHLDLSYNHIREAGAKCLAGVLGQCAALAHLDLCYNQIGPAGAESLAGVLALCPALAYLDLSGNDIGPDGAEGLAAVLAQCTALTHLNLGQNQIRAAGAASLAGVLAQCTALAHLNLYSNDIRAAGAQNLAGVLGQCAALAHLNLHHNEIRAAGAESLAGVLAQCPALTDLNLSDNRIGTAGAESFAGVLGQCTALAHLDLSQDNDIGTVGTQRLRASWRGHYPVVYENGVASGLLL